MKYIFEEIPCKFLTCKYLLISIIFGIQARLHIEDIKKSFSLLQHPLTLIGMSSENKKNAHLQSPLEAGWQDVKLTRLMSIFTSKKGWKFFIQIQLTKSNPKITRGVKVTCLMPNRVEADVKSFKEKQKQKFRRMSYLLHATIISFFLYFLLCFHIFLTF